MTRARQAFHGGARRAAAWLRSLLVLPLYVLALLSQNKSFLKNPVLGNPLLNRLGLHVARVVAAYAVTGLRWRLLAGLVPAAERSAYRRDGYLVVEDFLPAELFAALAAEARAYQGAGLEQTQGNTHTQHVFLDADALAGLPASAAVVAYPRLRRLLKYTGSHNAMPHMFLQRIAHGFADGGPDPQKSLHKDTFHPTMKAWLFIDDVGPERGPFTYVPGSHRLTWRRLAWEYRHSLAARGSDNSHTANGSFRVTGPDLAAMGLGEPQAIAVRRNTLVLANTVGFHCRGQAQPHTTRLELWAFSRRNPFLPWPGIDSRWLSGLEFRAVRAVRRLIERRQDQAGQAPVWRTTTLDFRN